MSSASVASLPASEVKTEPATTEIDIKEEPLEQQLPPPEQPPSAAVAAATQLLQHQLSGIKDTLRASKTDPRPEDIAEAKDQEEGEIDDDEKKDEKCGKEQHVEGADDVAIGRAARMPVWQALGDNEEFPLPHWIGVSGTSSDNLNHKTREFIGRIKAGFIFGHFFWLPVATLRLNSNIIDNQRYSQLLSRICQS